MLEPSKFLQSREICSNLPNGIHEIAEHIAKRTEKQQAISPRELALIFTAVLEEEKIKEFELFPQLIDKMVQDDIEYSNTFRKICQEVMGINPPIIIDNEEYPESIKVAVEWWAKAILLRDVANMPNAFQSFFSKVYTDEEIAIFKATLAMQIARKLAEEKEVWLSSEWTADSILENAGTRIGVNPLLGYPNASMVIYEDSVKVTVDEGNTWETIYSNY